MKRSAQITSSDNLTEYLKDAEQLIQAIAESAGTGDVAGLRGAYCLFAVHALTHAPVRTSKERDRTLQALRELFPAAMNVSAPQTRQGLISRLFHRK